MRNKEKLLTSIIAVFFVLTLVASTAFAVTLYMQTINYQGSLADSGGVPINGPVSMTFAIYNTPSGGAPLWSETKSSVTVTNGAFSVVLGSINPITLPFDEQYYLGVQVDTDAEMAPRAFLLSVPYAMRAAEVDAIAAGSVTSTEIADGAVTGAKLSVPLDLSAADSSPIIRSTNTGTGKAGEFKVDNASSSAHAISATTNGNGYAVYGSSSGTGYAMFGLNTGTGIAGSFVINNPVNANHTVFSQTVGSGNAFYGITTGTGRAGYFRINNAGNAQPALEATSNGSGYTIYGNNSGTGKAGLFQITNGSSGAQALFASTLGTGYSGYFSGGAGVYVSGNLNVTGTITGDGSELTGVPVGAHNHDSEYVNVSGDSMTDMLSVETSTLVSIYGRNYGTGRAGSFVLDNPASTNSAIYTTSNGSGDTVYASATGTGKAGLFEISNASNTANALEATSNGSGDTVYAEATGTGKAGNFVAGSGTAVSAISDGSAVYARTNGTTGRAGYFWINNSSSTWEAIVATTLGSGNVISAYTNGTGKAGEFKITNINNTSYALHALTAGKGRAGHFEIHNAGSTAEALFAMTNGSGSAVKGTNTGSGYSASFWGGAGVFVSGDLEVIDNVDVWGNLNVSGTKNFVQPHPTDPTKQIAYVAMEAPESAVMIRGRARLVDGRAVIETPEYFRLVAGGNDDITVQFTPRTLNTLGLAAVEVTKEKIVVGELMNGTGSFEFDYFITAKRAGFEGHEPIQPNTNFTADMKTAEEFEQAYAKDDMTVSAMRRLLISNGILTADGKLNMELAKELGWAVKDSDVAMKNAE